MHIYCMFLTCEVTNVKQLMRKQKQFLEQVDYWTIVIKYSYGLAVQYYLLP